MPHYNGEIRSQLEEFQRLGAIEGGNNRPTSDSIAPDNNQINLINKVGELHITENKLYVMRLQK